MLKETLRSRWFSIALHVGLWLLLVMAVAGLGGRRPGFADAETGATTLTVVPVAKVERLFAPANQPRQVFDSALQSAFATLYFTPPVVPIPVPTTRRLDITYQGYYQSAGGPLRAMLRAADLLVSVPVGSAVVSNLWVAEATFLTMTLTNSAGQTNVLKMNVKQEVEVPLK
jgi:hypothetical protein